MQSHCVGEDSTDAVSLCEYVNQMSMLNTLSI